LAVFEFVRDVAPEFSGTPDRAAREFFVSFYNIATRNKWVWSRYAVPVTCVYARWCYPRRVRDLKTHLIGHLVSFSGTVTRASEVRPELLYGVFKCALCGMLSGKVEQQFKYTEPSFCTQTSCGNRTKWAVRRVSFACVTANMSLHLSSFSVQLEVANSQFVDWQRVRVQENPDEIPPGT
jgi:DNA replicative helicase MCM subunit Mcm2 (Cdc46/Mcm family)